jgi:hypothetical protein
MPPRRQSAPDRHTEASFIRLAKRELRAPGHGIDTAIAFILRPHHVTTFLWRASAAWLTWNQERHRSGSPRPRRRAVHMRRSAQRRPTLIRTSIGHRRHARTTACGTLLERCRPVPWLRSRPRLARVGRAGRAMLSTVRGGRPTAQHAPRCGDRAPRSGITRWRATPG